MKSTGVFGSKAGVTLVELLVVMLIVVILTVSLTPLFRDYLIRSQYVAEAVPVIGDLRLKAELFRYDNSHLPGVRRNANGPLRNDSKLAATPGGMEIQTFVAVAAVAGDSTNLVFRPAWAPINAGAVVGTLSTNDSAYHFATDMNVNYENFSGSRLRPNHVSYYAARADAGWDLPQEIATRVAEGGYLYVAGVFGDGRLPPGTGYAVLELNNPGLEKKIVATWERYRAAGTNAGQVVMASFDEFTAGAAASLSANVCFIGDTPTLLGNDLDDFNDALEQLREANWKF